MIRFQVVVRAHCGAEKIVKTIESVRRQTVPWFVSLYMDGPPRNTWEPISRRYADDPLVAVDPDSPADGPDEPFPRLGVAGTMSRALDDSKGFPTDSLVIAILDGDGDTLPKDALARVAHVYEKYPDTLVTYGSYKKKSKGDRTKISQAYPKGADVRKYPWHASHLKTFRACLLPHVKPEWFQDSKGKWLQAASDVALMLPLMELAGLDRCRHIHEITYAWNDSPVSRAKRALQKRCEAIVRAKPREKRLP